jgi:DNA gyrase subunit B
MPKASLYVPEGTFDIYTKAGWNFAYIYEGERLEATVDGMHYVCATGDKTAILVRSELKAENAKIITIPGSISVDNDKYRVIAVNDTVFKGNADIATMFSAQAKDRVLLKPFEKVITETIFNELDSKYIAQVGDMVEVIVGNHRARIEGEKARSINSITRDKKKWTQPDQFYPCSTVKTDMPKEIFLCEGDSAGGGLKLARDAKYQALLTFKGKSLNVAKGNVDEVRALQSMPLENLTNCLGCGIGPTFDIRKLKYPNILIATDADIDGYHIRTILLTFFLRFMPDLIREGHVYVIEPPLYELRQGKKMLYVASQKEYADTCIKSIGKMVVNLPKTKYTCDAREFVREAFDYRSNIVAASYERFVNRYLLEYIADGFVKYGTVDNFIEHINDWIRSLCKIYSEIGFDDKTNQLHATIDLVDQVVVIDDKLMESLGYVIAVLKRHGLLIKEMENNKCVSQTTLLRFFEHIEDGYPKIVQRYKGLGSSQPIITREFVTDPRTRRAIKITMNNVNTFTRINDLMGDSKENVRNRKELLMDFPFTKDMLDN